RSRPWPPQACFPSARGPPRRRAWTGFPPSVALSREAPPQIPIEKRQDVVPRELLHPAPGGFRVAGTPAPMEAPGGGSTVNYLRPHGSLDRQAPVGGWKHSWRTTSWRATPSASRCLGGAAASLGPILRSRPARAPEGGW